MHWNSAAEFFAMGGYALYVWLSFGACALVMTVEPLLVKQRQKAAIDGVRRQTVADQLDTETP